VKTVHGWPGKVVVVGCEPAIVEEMGMGLSPEVDAVVSKAVDVVIEQIRLLKTDAPYEQAAGEAETARG
jgi:Ni,Fe-hydrogenase maturation factor